MPRSVTHPIPLGKIHGTPTWYQLVARHQGYLLQPTLTATPPGFRRTTEASLPASAGRQAKTFCYKVDTVFINSDIYICIIWLGNLELDQSTLYIGPLFLHFFVLFCFVPFSVLVTQLARA